MNKKIVNNAICAYFWLWVLLLLPSKNSNINNVFVKTHAKTASFIHLLFLITYIIFITYWFLGNFMILGYTLNNIFAPIIFLWLFWWLIFWTYKASLWKNFEVKDMAEMTKTSNIFELKQSNLNEQWILTTILSLIPFIWFTIKWKFYNYKSPLLENNLKLNLLLTSFVFIVFLLWFKNLWILFLLWLIIFLVFYSILLIINKNIISINLDKIPTFEEFIVKSISFFKYLKSYFTNKNFTPIATFEKEIIQKNTELKNKKTYEVLTLNEPKLKPYMYYIPYLNLISVIDYNSKYKYHIKNGLSITFLSIIMIPFWNDIQFFNWFLIFFGLWYLKDLSYSFPILWGIYNFFEKIIFKIFFIWEKVQKTSKKVEEVSFKL